MARNGITAEQAIQAARDSRGFVTTIARRLGCSRTYVYHLRDKFVTFAEAIEEEREGLKDDAEGKLQEKIGEGNMTAIIFYLKTQAKDRGYIEGQEISVKLEQELSKVLDDLEKGLDDDTYRRVIAVISQTG